jgi:DNA polymerase III delta prime subunit
MEIFLSKYKPYHLKEFGLDPKRMQLLNTLFEIEDIQLLLVGPPCSGKTTLLYAILREYYQLSKTDSLSENNILFIHQLKEQGIHFFRNEMKTFCQSKCSIHGKKKMIVIDDIDNLNEQIQQVLRNHLDKYKHNIHIISACTNIQKVIESIQSRTHILQLNMPTHQQIGQLMQHILQDADIHIEPEALQKLHRQIESEHEKKVEIIVKLEKMFIYSNQEIQWREIQWREIEDMTSQIKKEDLAKYIQHVKKRELAPAIQEINKMQEKGYSVIDILENIYNYIKETDELTDKEKYQQIPLICKYITIFNKIHEDGIELALFTNQLIQQS